jgi:hypothetical protein
MEMTLRLGFGVVILASRIGHIELGEHVAGRQHHLLYVGRVPSGENQATIVGVGS